MASGGGNAQFTLGGFTKTKNPFEINSHNNSPNSTTTGGSFSFGVPTSFSGQSTTTSPFGNTPFSTGQTSHVFTTSTNNSFTRSPFGTGPFSTGQTSSSSTTSPFGTAPSPFGTAVPSFTQTNKSSTSQPFGTAPFSFQQISTPSPSGTSPFSTGQTSNSSTTKQFGTAPFSFQQTSNSLTTSPFSTAPFSFQQTNNSLTTSPSPSPFSTAPFPFQPTSKTTTPSPFNQNNSSTTSPFGQTSSSLTISPFTIPPPSPFSQTNNSLTTSPFTIPPPSPFSQTNNSLTTSPFTQTNNSHTTSPFTIGPPNPFSQTNNSSTTSPFGTAPFSFQQTCNSLTTSPCRTAPFSYQQTSNSLTTSPFGTFPFSIGQTGNSSTTKQFETAPFSLQQTSNSLITSPSGIAPFSFDVSPSSPFRTSVSTPTIPASNVSVFPPFTSTVPWKSIVQGTRYEETAEKEANGTLSKILSISAMPFYEKKSHEELRLEDYISSGKTGNTSTFVSPIAILNTSPSTTTTTIPSSFTSPSIMPSIFTTSIPSNIQPVSQPVITPFHPVVNLFPTIQTITTTTVPNSGTGVIQNNTVPVTPFPGNVSQGYPIPKSDCLTENNQQQPPASPCPMPVLTKPFASEVRDTLPMKTVQHGISCLPVSENPKPAKKMPLVNVRQLSHARHRRSIEKYKPKEDEKKVPFFEELLPWIYKKGAVVIPRENPRSWVVLPYEVQSLQTDLSELSVSDQSLNLCKTEDGNQVEECVPKTCSSGDEDGAGKKNTGAIISNDQDDKDPDILAMIPKLRSPDYYMEPSTEDLAEIELRRPGFCCKVKDFVIGRRNYGNIKFLGETDVRNLDVESIVQFGNREVVVYKDEKGKPPVGQGLNKAAEITLLNIKYIDKSTGNRCIDGPRVDKYKELLKRKATEQGSEFVSYDPVKGEWRFKVDHF